jgi:hypothetical protein
MRIPSRRGFQLQIKQKWPAGFSLQAIFYLIVCLDSFAEEFPELIVFKGDGKFMLRTILFNDHMIGNGIGIIVGNLKIKIGLTHGF